MRERITRLAALIWFAALVAAGTADHRRHGRDRPDLSSGVITEHLENESFDVPTTIDRFGNTLYAVNARFSTPPEPTTDYSITATRRR